jgi:hypothetical protein
MGFMTPSERVKRANIWNKHIETWEKSGQSQAEYCRKNMLSDKSFCYWLRKHRRQNQIQLVPVTLSSRDFEAEVFEFANSGLVLKLGSKALIEIPRDFDSITFEKVVRIVADL